MMKSLFAAAAFIVAAWTFAHAQPVDTLEVRATRAELPLAQVPAAVTVIDGEDLRTGRLPASLAEALDQVPGLFIQNAGNFSQDARIALRGFGAQSAFGIRGVTLLVDGVPQTLPDGQAQVDAIDLAEVERIEILRGPASALYGNAGGGVILITTRPADETAEAAVAQQFGEFGRRHGRVSLAAPLGPVGMRLSASRFAQDGFREHSGVTQRRVGLKLAWQPAERTRLQFDAGLFDAPQEFDPGGLTASQAAETPRLARPANVRFAAGESLSQWRTALGFRHAFGSEGHQQIEANAFLFLRDFENWLPFSSGGQVDLDRGFGGGTLRHEVELSPAGRALRITSGADWRMQQDERRRFDNLDGRRGERVLDQHEQVDALGVFVQSGWAIDAAWHLTAGLRFDSVRLEVDDRLLVDGDASGARTWQEVSPLLGVNWTPGPHWTLYASYGRIFQTPTTTELANPDDPAAGGGFNPSLGPETADSLEFGVRWQREALRLDATLYRMDVDDAITSFEVPEFSGSGRDFFANAGHSTRTGVEIEGRWRLSPSLEFGAGYSGSDFVFDRFDTADGDFSGNRLPGVPRHRFGFNARLQPSQDFEAFMAVSRVGGFFADNANSARNPARTETRIEIRRRWSSGPWQAALSLGVINLLDQRYNDNVRVNAFGGRYFEPAPDRHVFAGLELGWR